MDYIIETFQGQRNIVIFDTVNGEPHNRLIPLTAVASWMELLGITDPAVALDAIVHVQDNGEPEVNYETGENAWTPTYGVLGELLATGDCPTIDQVQEQTRGSLGIDQVEPPVQMKVMRRMAAVFTPQELLHQELRGMDDELGPLRSKFLGDLIPLQLRGSN